MNNNERLADDNTTVSIPNNEKKSPVESSKAEKQKKSSITIRELTIIGLLAGITIALGLSLIHISAKLILLSFMESMFMSKLKL